MRKPLRMGARRRGNPLPTLGDLRKGPPKGEGTAHLKELTDFRLCNYDEDDAQLMAFIKSIGTLVPAKPKPYYVANHLGFVFPEATVRDNLMVSNECYKGDICIHRCTPDEDRIVLKALDPHTLRQVVINGRHVDTGEIVRCDDKPIYSYTGKNGVVEVGCSPVVRMKIMLRGQGRVATWDVLSSSGWDGESLQLKLETFYDAFSANHLLNGLRGIPFILHRMPPVDVPYYDDSGERRKSKHSYISIEIAPDFGALYMESAVRYALEAVDVKQIAPPAVEDDREDDTILDQSDGGVNVIEHESPHPVGESPSHAPQSEPVAVSTASTP